MNKPLRPFILLAISIFIAIGAQAQSPSSDIIGTRSGDLWAFSTTSSAAAQLTFHGYSGGPILAPDGRQIAYLMTSPAFVQELQAGATAQAYGAVPVDIWVMDIATRSFTRIADQTGASPSGYLRSQPAWSPDSRRLAWLQVDPGTQARDQATLQIHDLDARLTRTIARNVNLGYHSSYITMPVPQWGGGGIATLLYAFLHGDNAPFLFMDIFDPESGELTRYNLNLDAERSNFVHDYMWVSHLGYSLLALRIQDRWELLDPADGSRAQLIEAPRLRNRFVSGGLELIPQALPRPTGGWEFHWYAQHSGSSYRTGYVSRAVDGGRSLALSPDGAQLAWYSGSGITRWQIGSPATGSSPDSQLAAGSDFPTPGPVSLAWSAGEWITSGGTAAAQTAPTAAPAPAICTLPAQLQVGQRAIVGPGLANRVREGASINTRIVGTIRPGEVVDVERGPVCANGYYWYAVRNDRISGWTVEGSGDAYWLYYHIGCPQSPPTRLTANMNAQVIAPAGSPLRAQVNAEGTLAQMPAGSRFVITGNPVCDAAGLRWYPIQFGGLLGWAAEGEGATYWIEAVDAQS